MGRTHLRSQYMLNRFEIMNMAMEEGFDYRSSIRAFVSSLREDDTNDNAQKVAQEVKLNSGYILPPPKGVAFATQSGTARAEEIEVVVFDETVLKREEILPSLDPDKEFQVILLHSILFIYLHFLLKGNDGIN